MIAIYFLSVFVFFLLVIPFSLTFLTFFIRKNSISKKHEKELSIACIITGYKNVSITIPCVESLLKQIHKKYTIYLVLDNCEIADKYPISDNRLIILNPPKALNSKLKSISMAIDYFTDDHEYMIVFDPDNIVPNDFLSNLNKMAPNFSAIQVKRKAKNISTIFSKLDAIGELYHNFNDRRNLFLLGSSATYAGSGLLIKVTLFKKFISELLQKNKMDSLILGEDKLFQNYLVLNNERIAFTESIVLFDEKVNSKSQVRNQRIRWLNTYFQNLIDALKLLMKGIFSLNWNLFLFGFSSLYPPLFIVFLLSLSMAGINLYLNTTLFLLIVIGLGLFITNFLLSLYFSKAPASYYKAMFFVPYFIIQQIYSLLHLKRAKNDFLVTESSEDVSIEDLLSDESDK